MSLACIAATGAAGSREQQRLSEVANLSSSVTPTILVDQPSALYDTEMHTDLVAGGRWDNRCSYHKAAGDYPPEEDRIHWRVSIKEHRP